MDYSPPGFSVLWIFPGKNTGVGCHFLLQGLFRTQESNSSLLHWQGDFLPLSHQGSPDIKITDTYHAFTKCLHFLNPGAHTSLWRPLCSRAHVGESRFKMQRLQESDTLEDHWKSKSCTLRAYFLEKKMQRTPIFLPGESHGQRSLAGYSPWGRKESDMTEQLNSNKELALVPNLPFIWGRWRKASAPPLRPQRMWSTPSAFHVP